VKQVPLTAGVQEQLKTIAHESPGSVEELQLETWFMCSPGLEVEVQFAAPLALGGSVGDDGLDRTWSIPGAAQEGVPLGTRTW
jgi:hypothetical protein